MSIIGEFRVGEDVLVALDAVSGDPLTVDSLAAWITPGEPRSGGPIVREGAARTELAVSSREAAGDVPAGWTLTLTAAQSAELGPGLYGIDARLAIGSGIDITDTTAFIRLTRSAAA